MLRVESNTKLETVFTEYEEDILFDNDDPDFIHEPSLPNMPLAFGRERNVLFRETCLALTNTNVPSSMSLASLHPAELRSSHSSLTTLSHSLDDISACSWGSQVQSDHVMTIEELRLQMTSCFTCGVSWTDSHVSLDCAECGGYAMERPCPVCDGTCGAIWKRDLSLSHASSKARWQGECAKFGAQQQQTKESTTTSSSSSASIAQELSTRLEKLSANS